MDRRNFLTALASSFTLGYELVSSLWAGDKPARKGRAPIATDFALEPCRMEFWRLGSREYTLALQYGQRKDGVEEINGVELLVPLQGQIIISGPEDQMQGSVVVTDMVRTPTTTTDLVKIAVIEGGEVRWVFELPTETGYTKTHGVFRAYFSKVLERSRPGEPAVIMQDAHFVPLQTDE